MFSWANRVSEVSRKKIPEQIYSLKYFMRKQTVTAEIGFSGHCFS